MNSKIDRQTIQAFQKICPEVYIPRSIINEIYRPTTNIEQSFNFLEHIAAKGYSYKISTKVNAGYRWCYIYSNSDVLEACEQSSCVAEAISGAIVKLAKNLKKYGKFPWTCRNCYKKTVSRYIRTNFAMQYFDSYEYKDIIFKSYNAGKCKKCGEIMVCPHENVKQWQQVFKEKYDRQRLNR